MAKYRLNETDLQILDMLIKDARKPYVDIAKELDMSAGAVNARIRKLEELNIIKGSTITVDYEKIKYNFIAYVGVLLERNHQAEYVLEQLEAIPFVTESHITSGKYNIFCKIRARGLKHAKEIIYMIDEIQGVARSETMISMEEVFNDEGRLIYKAFSDLDLHEYLNSK
ncbi:transcriptional regulator [Capnocytophaga sp. HP1101]